MVFRVNRDGVVPRQLPFRALTLGEGIHQHLLLDFIKTSLTIIHVSKREYYKKRGRLISVFILMYLVGGIPPQQLQLLAVPVAEQLVVRDVNVNGYVRGCERVYGRDIQEIYLPFEVEPGRKKYFSIPEFFVIFCCIYHRVSSQG